MADINITASIRTLNLNVLSSLMKEDGSAEWVIQKKNMIKLYAIYKRHILNSKI